MVFAYPWVLLALAVPVLLIVFNRAEKAARVLDALRRVEPRRLYVAADGPRRHVPGDVERCERTRRLLDDVGWPCEVHTLYQDRNLGCKVGPETAISWFFEQVEAGIILEDDCVPVPDFFPFCAELLDRYAHVAEVMMVGGHNRLGTWDSGGVSYVFSRTSPIWGWATWRRAWDAYDGSITAWADPEIRARIRSIMSRAEFQATARRLDSVRRGQLEAWDFGWALALMRSGGLSAVATRNLVANIGFDEEATHTKNRLAHTATLPTYPLDLPLNHPNDVRSSAEFDRALFRYRFPLSRRIVTALPHPVQAPLRTGLQQATAILARAKAGGRAR